MFLLTQKLKECQMDQLNYRTRPSCYRNTRLWLKLCDRGVSPLFRNLPTEKLDWDTKWMWQKSLRWNVSALNSSYVECHSRPCVSWYFVEVLPIWIYGHYLYDYGEERSMNKFQRYYTHKTTMLMLVIKNSRQGAGMLAMEIGLAFFTNCVILSHWKDLDNNCKYESQRKLNFLWRETVLWSVILYG